jgi:hypothetical protein
MFGKNGSPYLFGKITMKPSYVIGGILAVAFAVVWCLQLWSAGQWKTELQGDGEGTFYEQKRMAETYTREVFKDRPDPVNHPMDMSSSGSSWEDGLGKESTIGFVPSSAACIEAAMLLLVFILH